MYFAYSLMIQQEKNFNPVHQISDHSTQIEGQKKMLTHAQDLNWRSQC